MKDYKFYSKISVAYWIVFAVLSIITLNILLKSFTVSILDVSLSNLKNETTTIKRVYAKVYALDKNFDDQLLIQNIIEDTHKQNSFISIINWAGNYVCYPEIFKVGEKPLAKNNFENEKVDASKLQDYFFSFLSNLKPTEEVTPIIALETINNSDLIIANHINLEEIHFSIKKKRTFYIGILSILGLLLWLFVLWLCRYLSNYFNKQIDKKVEELVSNSKSIEDLNSSLEKYQENLKNIAVTEVVHGDVSVDVEEITKERILTYVRNELVPITISSIAYIYVENTITYIVTKEGKKSTTPDSLDKIYSLLDEKVYFKVNRQFIVGISAIEKITKYENSKLKLQVNPTSELDIIIGKNKVAQFKQWLDL